MSDKVRRLHEIATAIAKGDRDELTMRIPAEPDRDADLVVSWAATEIERLTRRLEGATRLLNAWHFEYHYGRRLEGIDDDTTTWLGGIDVPDRAADQPAAAHPCVHDLQHPMTTVAVRGEHFQEAKCFVCGQEWAHDISAADNSGAAT